jgi:hypothetical protein
MNTAAAHRQHHTPEPVRSAVRRTLAAWALCTLAVGLFFGVLHIASLSDQRAAVADAIAQRAHTLQQQAQARKDRAGRAICREKHPRAQPVWADDGDLSCILIASNKP